MFACTLKLAQACVTSSDAETESESRSEIATWV